MCTPVYVTVRAASSLAPMVSYLVGAVILGVGSIVCFIRATKSRGLPT
jgi:hypothetical protein